MKYNSKSSKTSKSGFKVPTSPPSISRKEYKGSYTGVSTSPIVTKIGKTFKQAP